MWAADYQERCGDNFSPIHTEETSNVDKIIYVDEINNSNTWKLIYQSNGQIAKIVIDE